MLTSHCDLFGSQKLACMSAAASGCLQLKILQWQRRNNHPTVSGKCFCGSHESLFPIPLIESYCSVIRLYYGKTVHDVEGTYVWSGFPGTMALGIGTLATHVGCRWQVRAPGGMLLSPGHGDLVGCTAGAVRDASSSQ